jgi:cell division protein FtsZ
MNLQGARGILVNVTTNGDLGLNEFDEIGSIMHAFASDDADIKIGMAVNPTMGNELKVTVVATGMGEKVKAANAPIKLVQKVAAGEVNYDQLEKPTVIRQRGQETVRESRFGAQPRNDVDLDYLDVPAFLRRQAD